MATQDGGIPSVTLTKANANGLKVIAQATKYLGVVESPPLSSGGSPYPHKWQANFGLGNVAWCGCFATSMYIETGVDDLNLGDPNVKNIWKKAQAANPKCTSTLPVAGCFVIFGEWDSSGNITVGHHVELFVRWYSVGKRQIVTIGGNTPIDDLDTNDGVMCKVRSITSPISSVPAARLKFVVPPSISKLDQLVTNVGGGLHPVFVKS